MNKGLNNHMTIYGLLSLLYAKYKAILDLNIMIAALFINIELNRTELAKKIAKAGGDNTGIAEEKQVDRDALTNEILKNAGPASSCLIKKGKLIIGKKIKTTRWALNRMTAEELNAFAKMVVDECTLLLTDIVSSGVTAISLGKITTATGVFYTEKDEPTSNIKSVAIINEEIAVLDKINLDIMNNELKSAMMFYIDSEPVMYSEFLKNTKAPKVGVRKPTGKRAEKANVKVIVLHDLTSEPVVDAVIKYVGTRGSFNTDENGISNTMINLGPQLGKIVSVDMISQSFIFTLTEEGIVITIRLIPVGV